MSEQSFEPFVAISINDLTIRIIRLLGGKIITQIETTLVASRIDNIDQASLRSANNFFHFSDQMWHRVKCVARQLRPMPRDSKTLNIIQLT